MPRSFTEHEREYIKRRLKEEAKECLNLYGIKKTTVDELVKRANIPKGTFYLFYDSKELILFDVINDVQNEIQNQIVTELHALNGNVGSEKLAELLFMFYKKAENTFFLNILTNGELELLMRKLPLDIVDEHFAQDDFIIEKILSVIPHKPDIDAKILSGALRGVFLSMLHKREIGEDVFDDALKLMIKGIAIQLMEEKND
ncbi:TetR/AcrR family transcriptional regulator [Sedimentibacter sp.]|uniref:TetR/AcrR family transcriptional regulator n=1 Tax=Sedimentibacter sp. TaxID=1960295 RepID=UPI00289D7531|nr:TetR/AcrR family transcriptional regulator [Sedimentibacter sp.]